MILVFGKTGQVAREVLRQGDVVALGREEADLSDPKACAAVILAHAPRGVINAAAYTAVDAAEQDEALVQRINADAPAAMALACAQLGIPFVHLSTDYVFAGTGTKPHFSTDPTGPLGAYGRTKRAGETGVQAAGGTYVILRTSWVFSAHGNNFVKTMLRLGGTRDQINVVADQVGGPTAAADIAAACLDIVAQLQVAPDKSGIVHFAGAPDVSWACFARETFMQASLSCEVVDIATSAYPTPAKRPLNSRMDCSGLSRFNLSRPDWRLSLTDVLKDLGALV